MRKSNGRRTTRWTAGLLMGAAIALSASPGQALGPDGAEALVRAVWFEGLPESEAAQIDADGAAHLASLLADPSEAEVHANVLLALAYSGQPAAVPAVIEWASVAPDGEVDRNTFRAWQILPIALGRLAAQDRAALQRLGGLLQGEPVEWHFRHHSAARVERMGREGAASALADTGLPEADAMLERAHALSSDSAFRAHVESVRAAASLREEGAE